VQEGREDDAAAEETCGVTAKILRRDGGIAVDGHGYTSEFGLRCKSAADGICVRQRWFVCYYFGLSTS
jgi:hypothetical protein